MPREICLRQLRSALPETASPLRIARLQCAAFSTTPPYNAPAPKKTSAARGAPPKRGTKALRINKNVRDKSGKRPEPGERKAARKRVVLSNTNALIVPGLQDLSAQNMAIEESRGKVLGLSSTAIDALRALDAFKPRQGWSFFRRPAVLMRKESLEVAKLLEGIQSAAEPRTSRKIIIGERSSGKSTLLLQAMAMAVLKGWIVISIPEAQDLVNANTDYAPQPNTTPTQYIQKSYTRNLLRQIGQANREQLSKLQLSQQHQLPVPVPDKISLDRFCEMGASDLELAWPFFTALWQELTTTSARRPPVLLTLDGVHHVMKDSTYKSPELKPIHAHDLSLVSWFMSHLGGQAVLPNGGAVIASTSESNRPASPVLEFALTLNERSQIPDAVTKPEEPVWNPYKTFDQRVMDAMSGVEILRLRGLSKDEARSIMEYWAKSGMMRQAVDDGLVGERWALSGGGVIGELERCSVRWRV